MFIWRNTMYGLQCLLHFSASSSFIFSELWELPQSWVQSKVCLVTMEAKYQKKQWENALLQSSPHERLKGHWGPSTVETPQPQQMKRGTQKKHIYTSIVLHEYCFWRRSRSSTHGQRPCRWLQHVSSWGLLKGDPQQYKMPNVSQKLRGASRSTKLWSRLPQWPQRANDWWTWCHWSFE